MLESGEMGAAKNDRAPTPLLTGVYRGETPAG
jgi:hypothetical protein